MKAQITKAIMKRLGMLLFPLLAVGVLTVSAHANDRATKIQGKGIVDMVASADTFFPVNGIPSADLAYPNHSEFKKNRFAIKAKVYANGLATGTASFVFGDEFSNAWAAGAITLECEIITGSVSECGTVSLQGNSFEVDFDEFGNVILEELSPCEIIISPAGSFSLRSCAIPALNAEVARGHLKVK